MKKTIRVTPGYIKRLISEEKQTLLEHQRFKQMIVAEGLRLQAEGYSPQRIDEGLLDIIKSLGGGFVEGFKYEIAMALLTRMGLPEEGFLARAIANTFENAHILDFKRYFADETGCQELADLIMVSLIETGTDPLVDGFMSGLGVPTDSRIYVSIKEALSKQLLEGELAEYIKGSIADWICEFDVSNIVDVFKSGIGKVGSFFGGGSEPEV